MAGVSPQGPGIVDGERPDRAPLRRRRRRLGHRRASTTSAVAVQLDPTDRRDPVKVCVRGPQPIAGDFGSGPHHHRISQTRCPDVEQHAGMFRVGDALASGPPTCLGDVDSEQVGRLSRQSGNRADALGAHGGVPPVYGIGQAGRHGHGRCVGRLTVLTTKYLLEGVAFLAFRPFFGRCLRRRARPWGSGQVRQRRPFRRMAAVRIRGHRWQHTPATVCVASN